MAQTALQENGDGRINGPETVEGAVAALINGNDRREAADYLRGHPHEAGEFCLQVIEAYPPKEARVAAMQLSFVMEMLLGLEAPDQI